MNKFMMQQAQQFQAKLAKAQQELDDVTLEAGCFSG